MLLRALAAFSFAAALSVNVIDAAHADDGRMMDVLVAAYPEFLAGHDDKNIIWKDGTKTLFDDGRSEKSFEELLKGSSLKDMFYDTYPAAMPKKAPEENSDPGRVRNEAFFTKMYGDCRQGDVTNSLVDVVWLPKKWGKTVRANKINGVAEKLKAVSEELDRLPARFDKYLFPPSGTYNCRNIAGTGRLSAHGTATAIDIATEYTNYWRWGSETSRQRAAWRNEIPAEIVEIFEKHGFIWGGKWYHFDTMHFEYRPEIIAAGKR